jgi:AcrR family transcriptional regulator
VASRFEAHSPLLAKARGLRLNAADVSPEAVEQLQRWRLIDALVALSARQGYAATTISQIRAEVHMAAQTFAALFEDKDACLRGAYSALAAQLEADLDSAWQGEREWPRRVRAAIAAALAFAAAEPAAARLLAVEIQAGDAQARALQSESVERLAARLREGRDRCPEAAALNDLAETVLVGGIVALIGNRLLDGEAERLSDLEGELVELALAPCLGVEAAGELARS